MGKESKSIKLRDFLVEIADAMGYDKGPLEMVEVSNWKCSKCGSSYSEGTKFCSEDGKPVVEEKYNVDHKDFNRYALDVIWGMEKEELPDSYPYEYVEWVEKRGDGSGYYTNHVIKRKSDEKYFYITSYEGEIEEDYFEETSKEVKVTAYIMLDEVPGEDSVVVDKASGHKDGTTNQEMEIIAVAEAFESLEGRSPEIVNLYSDSAYVINCLKDRWFDKWVSNGWLNNKKNPVENRDAWERLIDAVEKHTVNFFHVKRNTTKYIRLVDGMAKQASKIRTSQEQ
jgi:ribonuclease HI